MRPREERRRPIHAQPAAPERAGRAPAQALEDVRPADRAPDRRGASGGPHGALRRLPTPGYG